MNKSTDRVSASKITRKIKPNPSNEILKHIQINQEAKKLRHEQRKAHMDQLAADRKTLLELKWKGIKLREENIKLIRQLALKNNSKQHCDVGYP